MAHATATSHAEGHRNNPKIDEYTQKVIGSYKPSYTKGSDFKLAQEYFLNLQEINKKMAEWTPEISSHIHEIAGKYWGEAITPEKIKKIAEGIIEAVSARVAIEHFGLNYDEIPPKLREHIATLTGTTAVDLMKNLEAGARVNYQQLQSLVAQVVQNAGTRLKESTYSRLLGYGDPKLSQEVSGLSYQWIGGPTASQMIGNLKRHPTAQDAVTELRGLEGRLLEMNTQKGWLEKPKEGEQGKPKVPGNYEKLEEVFKRNEAPHEETPPLKKPLEEMAGARH